MSIGNSELAPARVILLTQLSLERTTERVEQSRLRIVKTDKLIAKLSDSLLGTRKCPDEECEPEKIGG